MSFFQVLSQSRLFLWVRYVRNLYSFIKDKEYVTLVLPHQKFVEGACASSLYKYYWFAEVFMHGNPLTFKRKNRLIILSPKYAVLELHYTFDEYLRNCIKSPERALVRKAIKNDFYAKEISYDEYLDEIKEINTSKNMRLGMEMSNDYVNPRCRDKIIKPLNPNVHTFGCFSNSGKLVGYYMFEKFTNFYHVVKGIGHASFLSYGIMNYLFAYSISKLSSIGDCEMLIYGTINKNKHNSGGLVRFKHNVGCKVKMIVYNGTRDDFKNLDEFRRRFVLYDDSAINFVCDYVLK